MSQPTPTGGFFAKFLENNSDNKNNASVEKSQTDDETTTTSVTKYHDVNTSKMSNQPLSKIDFICVICKAPPMNGTIIDGNLFCNGCDKSRTKCEKCQQLFFINGVCFKCRFAPTKKMCDLCGKEVNQGVLINGIIKCDYCTKLYPVPEKGNCSDCYYGRIVRYENGFGFKCDKCTRFYEAMP